jgi:hypothetical protein
MKLYQVNSIKLNKAAHLMWQWESSGRANDGLWKEAEKVIREHFRDQGEVASLLTMAVVDAMLITVRIANGFPPNDGVTLDHD